MPYVHHGPHCGFAFLKVGLTASTHASSMSSTRFGVENTSTAPLPVEEARVSCVTLKVLLPFAPIDVLH